MVGGFKGRRFLLSRSPDTDPFRRLPLPPCRGASFPIYQGLGVACCAEEPGSKNTARPLGMAQGGQGNRLKGSVSGEPRCRLCALITLRAVHSDLEFAAPRDADLPDEGRAYVEHVTTPDPLRKRSGGSQTSSELAMACVSAHRAKRTNRSPARATKHRWQGHRGACLRNLLANER